jgi:hypothetical protein
MRKPKAETGNTGTDAGYLKQEARQMKVYLLENTDY